MTSANPAARSVVDLPAGPVEYTDSGGDGPVIVLLHGLTIDSSVWRKVTPLLSGRFRCVAPTLPLGAHRLPMRPDADLSLSGMAGLVADFLEALDLRDVTLVLNDWGGAQVLLSQGRDERIGRLVLTACEAFDNYPPGLPGRLAGLAAAVPGGLYLTLQLARTTAFRRAPGGWGWMSKRPVPRPVMDGWFTPARVDPRVRRDLAKYSTSLPGRAELLDLAARMRRFDRPVLVVWAEEDKVMPAAHAERLVALFDDARLVRIPDSYTLLPEDQPDALAAVLDEFAGATRGRAAAGPDGAE